MRISDWSSDVCSSDLSERFDAPIGQGDPFAASQHRRPLRQIQAGGEVLAVAEQQAATQFGVAIELAIRPRQCQIHIDIEGVAFRGARSEENTSELQSLMRTSYAVSRLNNNNKHTNQANT